MSDAFAMTFSQDEAKQNFNALQEQNKDHLETIRMLRATISQDKRVLAEKEVFEEVVKEVNKLTGQQVKFLFGVINTPTTVLLSTGPISILKDTLMSNPAVVKANWDKFCADWGNKQNGNGQANKGDEPKVGQKRGRPKKDKAKEENGDKESGEVGQGS